MEMLLVITSLPSKEAAEKLAADVLEQRLVACVNLLAPCRSMYRWKGQLQQEQEHPLFMKTTRARYSALEQAIRASHPYELPEIIAVPVTAGLHDYLQWVESETQPPA